MIGFLTRARRPSQPVARHRARLMLESLEGRVTPAAPTIAAFSGRFIGSTVVVTGTVQDDLPGQVTVNLTGSVNATVHTDSTGAFTYITSSTSSLLAITALATDSQGLISAAVGITVTPSQGSQPPFMTMSVIYGSQRTVTLQGTVYDQNPNAIPVAVSGVVTSQTVYTDSQGHFSLTTIASNLGNVYAYATDFGGLQSNVASVTLTSNAPQITNMLVTSAGQNTYVLTGRVIDESPGGLTFTLGGEVNAFRGQVVTVASDGTFSVTVTITDPLDQGQISAQVTDWWGLTSNVAYCMLSR